MPDGLFAAYRNHHSMKIFTHGIFEGMTYDCHITKFQVDIILIVLGCHSSSHKDILNIGIGE